MAHMGADRENMLPRLQRLEYLIELLHPGGGGAGSTFAGPIVPNELAMTALNLPDGEQVFVLSHRSIWTKRNGVAGVQGVPPLSPHEVDAALDGTGVFCRTNYSDPALRIGINDIFIDPANILANDENNGLTALTPLKTGAELFRRWGWGAPVLVGPNLATSPDGFTTIHIQSDLVAPDQLSVNVIIATNGSLRFRGNTPTLIHAGTLTNAVTGMNRSAPLGGTRLTVRDNALANWAAAEAPNRRVRMINGTAGPAAGHNGGTFQPQTDSLIAPGQVQCTPCQATNEPGFSQTPIILTPSVGDTYNIESLTQCNFGLFQIAQQINPAFGGFNAFVNFVDLNFPSMGTIQWAPVVTGGNFSGPFLNFYQCTFDRNIDFTLAGSFNTIACYFFNVGFAAFGLGAPAGILGGGMNGTAPNFGFIQWGVKNPNSIIDFDFVANNSIFILLDDCCVKNCASWNAHVLAGINTGGHGMLIGQLGSQGLRGVAQFQATVWGNGGTGAGILVGAACNGVGAPQNITGGQGDFKLANNPVAGQAVYFDPGTSLYAPVGGQTTSWALLTAAKGAPGFGGGALWPDQQANWVALETTA